MSRKKRRKRIGCIAYLSTSGDIEKADLFENRQLRYISDYARAHQIDVIGIERRHAFGMGDVNRQFREMAGIIAQRRAEGVIVANMAAVSSDLEDAYRKVGMIKAAGGVIVTVDEGWLGMNIMEAAG